MDPIYNMKPKDFFFQLFKQSDWLTKLIFINVGAFVLLWLVEIISAVTSTQLYGFTLENISVSTNWHVLIRKPWTILSYMFFETSFINLFCNLLILSCFGRIFIELMNDKRLLATYVLGGVSGVLFAIIISVPLSTLGMIVLGPTTAILAVMVAIATYFPNYKVYLAFFGEVSLKVLAIIIAIIELMPILSLTRQGVPLTFLAPIFCKIGGMLYGFFWAMLLKNGTDISAWFIQLIDRTPPKKTPQFTINKGSRRQRDESYVDFEEVTEDVSQEEIDRILEKISQTGYDSLTKEEKESLFKQSKK